MICRKQKCENIILKIIKCVQNDDYFNVEIPITQNLEKSQIEKLFIFQFTN